MSKSTSEKGSTVLRFRPKEERCKSISIDEHISFVFKLGADEKETAKFPQRYLNNLLLVSGLYGLPFRLSKFAYMETRDGGSTQPILPVLLNYGGAKKFIAEMNAAELEEARQSIMRRAKEKAFSKGLPVYYRQQGQLVAEFPDGRIVPVTKR